MVESMCNRKIQLTKEEIAHYRKEGYVIPEYRLPESLVARLREMLDRLIADNPTVRPEGLMGVHIPQGYGSGIRGRKEFFELAVHPEILDMTEQLIGPNICLWGTQMFCKPSGIGREVPWHQDGEYWPINPLATVTAWVAFEDSTAENGCMRVIPRSHENKLVYSHFVSQRKDLALNRALEAGTFDESKSVNIELKAGQISFHDIFLVHGSNPNRSSQRRAGYTLRYMPTSSHFDRTISNKENTPCSDKTNVLNFSTRPIWLVRGIDCCGKNDFTIGHKNNDYCQ